MDDAVALVRQWMRDIDDRLGTYVDRFEQKRGQSVSCRACTTPGCCKQKVAVPLFEAIPIAARLREQGQDTPELRKRLRALGKEQASYTRAEWLNLDRPCVFLEDGRCAIYEDRPSACRAYYTFSEPALCNPPAGKPVEALACCQHVANESFAVADAFGQDHGLPRAEPGARQVFVDWLPTAVVRALVAFERPDWPSFVQRQSWPDAETIERWLTDASMTQEREVPDGR